MNETIIENKTIIENTLKFLQRTDLKGSEVPAFAECVNYLNNLLKEKSIEKKKK